MWETADLDARLVFVMAQNEIGRRIATGYNLPSTTIVSNARMHSPVQPSHHHAGDRARPLPPTRHSVIEFQVNAEFGFVWSGGYFPARRWASHESASRRAAAAMPVGREVKLWADSG